MAATFSHLWEVLVLALITFSLAQDENSNFIYNDFREANLHLDGTAYQYNDLLHLTHSFSGVRAMGHAFHPIPIMFNLSSSQFSSFSTNFVFAIVPEFTNLSGHGIAFVISPSMNLRNTLPSQYLGLFNSSNIGSPGNHILAVELDTVQDFEFGDIDDNHVGIDVNTLKSKKSAPAGCFSDAEGKIISLYLKSGDPMQIWIDYSGTEKLLNVTLAPITLPQKPNKPLLSSSALLSKNSDCQFH